MDIADSDIPVFIRRRRPVRDSIGFLFSHVYSILLLATLWLAFFFSIRVVQRVSPLHAAPLG